jgi:serine/threonine protein kinase
MSDATRTSDPDLTSLTGDFNVVGELGGRPHTQYLIATRKSAAVGKRRDDNGRVLVEVVRPPEGDESHALDHLASDTKLLSGLRHRRLVSIVEGRWLGPDAFAVIREYVDDPSVADLLARGDTFTNTRIAAILREVHGVLQWAREQDVVHRHVTPDRLFL